MIFEVSKLTKKPPRRFWLDIYYNCLQWWHHCTQLSAYWLGLLSVFIVKCKGCVIVRFGYNVSVMISWLFSCHQYLGSFDCKFWIWCFCYDFMIAQLSQTAEPKGYIYSVACVVWLWVLDVMFMLWFHCCWFQLWA